MTGTVVLITGIMAAGKSTVAQLLAERLLDPLAVGEVGRWRRWDWVADGWAEWHAVAPGAVERAA